MTAFPRLKTGAVMQYPAKRTLYQATAGVQFLDGQEQRYREHARTLRRWVIRLDLLEEDEAEQVREFFQEVQGRAGTFSFEDPWDNAIYSNCSLEDDEMVLESRGETRLRSVLVVREN